METKEFLKAVEFCKKFDKIVVTAQQRSGTTITGKSLAYSLGWEYVDESKMKLKNITTFPKLLINKKKFVVQQPGFRMILEQYIGDIKKYKVGVVVVKRDIEDIQKSRRRIGWKAANELVDLEKTKDIGLKNPVIRAEYNVLHLEYLLKTYPNFVFLFNYKDLEGHHFWIPKEKRLKFRPKQTTL